MKRDFIHLFSSHCLLVVRNGPASPDSCWKCSWCVTGSRCSKTSRKTDLWQIWCASCYGIDVSCDGTSSDCLEEVSAMYMQLASLLHCFPKPLAPPDFPTEKLFVVCFVFLKCGWGIPAETATCSTFWSWQSWILDFIKVGKAKIKRDFLPLKWQIIIKWLAQ